MKPRALALLVALSCGAPYQAYVCSPTTCNGCCDETDRCQPGAEPGACGIAGNTCTSCSATAVCAQGTCVATSSAGGGQGGGTGTAGGNGTAGGTTATAGGSGTAGGTAGTAGGTTGTAGGTTGTAGGTNGTAGGGTIGTAGGAAAGGAGGGTAGGTGGGAGSCGPQSCVSGCCSNGACTTPIPAACGSSGGVCTSCPQGQACRSNGTCGYAGNTYAGSPCATNADCTIGGVFGACNTGNSWPGGYCQDTCYLLSCHGTDVCLSNNCWERCSGPRTGQSTCRGGYVCLGLVLADGGTPSYGVCATDCRIGGCAQGTCGPLGYCQ